MMASQTEIDYFQLLDSLAEQFGSDKGTHDVNGLSGKGYTKVYAQYLAPFQGANIVILEIGVFKGASIKMWEGFFTNARIYGVDIDPRCKMYASEKSQILIGDQTDQVFLQSVLESIGDEIDIVIDDGGHKWLNTRLH